MKNMYDKIVIYLIATIGAVALCNLWASTKYEAGVITMLTFIFVAILSKK